MTQGERQISVLLVDDDEDDWQITRGLIAQTRGMRIRLDWVRTFDEALTAMRGNSHDVYLLDYHLGLCNGLQLLREATDLGLRRPAILLTGSEDIEIDMSAMKAGAADYLVKGDLRADILERSIRYAMERQKMLDALHHVATHDDLTNLKNRRELNRILVEELARFQRHCHPLSLVMIDIDHFKAVNDKYGHQIGDAVLRWIARSLQAGVREIDTVARYGGEELAIILPDTTTRTALNLAERLRTLVASQPFITTAEDDGPTVQLSVTISAGVAAADANLCTPEAMIAAADSALYDAKRAGRNRSIAFDPRHYTTLPLTTGLLEKSPP